jgi:chaperone BCS1
MSSGVMLLGYKIEMAAYFTISKLNDFYLFVLTFTKSNPVVSGLVGLWGIAAISFFTKSIPHSIWNFIVRQLTIRVIIKNDNYSYRKVLNWLENEEHTSKSRTLRIGGLRHRDEDSSHLVAGFGIHYFLIGFRPYRMSRAEDESKKTNGATEYIEIITLGRSRKPFVKLLEKAIPKENKANVSSLFVWYDHFWKQAVTQPARSLDSILISREKLNTILSHLDTFTQSQKWYDERGIPYRTGLCFHGVPGTGKTSLVKALCAYLKRDLYVLSLVGLSDKTIQEAFLEIPKCALVLIEDIDTFSFTRKRSSSSTEKSDTDQDIEYPLSLSGLLNAVDGAANSDGRILVISTNHLEKLDPALIRPGRVDHFVELNYLETETFGQAFKLFYPSFEIPQGVRFRKNVTPAEFQNLVLKNRENPLAVIQAVSEEKKFELASRTLDGFELKIGTGIQIDESIAE